MTFFAGASEPVWLMAKIAQLAGNMPKAARRLGARVSKLRTVLDYVQANPRRIGFERETAIEAGFAPPEPIEIFPSLVFPADPLIPGLVQPTMSLLASRQYTVHCWMPFSVPWGLGRMRATRTSISPF